MKTKLKKGFSLVELLVVITIMAILSVTAYMALGGQTSKARNARRTQNISTIQGALEIYFIENNNTYPAKLSDLSPDLIVDIPLDPSAPDGTAVSYASGNYTTAPPDYHYSYTTPAASTKSYQLGATLEDGDVYEAYVVGNATSDLLFPISGMSCGSANVPTNPAVPTCVPSKIW